MSLEALQYCPSMDSYDKDDCYLVKNYLYNIVERQIEEQKHVDIH